MNFYTRKRRTPAVIIVSLIDIFAILLIFVIVTSTFKRLQPEVTIKLPDSTSATPAKEAASNPIAITIDSAGNIFVDGPKVEPADLAAALKKVVDSQQPLAINADTQAPFGKILLVIDALKSAGLKSIPAFTETKSK